MDIVERLRKNCTCSEVGSTPCRFEEECQNAFDGADQIVRLQSTIKMQASDISLLRLANSVLRSERNRMKKENRELKGKA